MKVLPAALSLVLLCGCHGQSGRGGDGNTGSRAADAQHPDSIPGLSQVLATPMGVIPQRAAALRTEPILFRLVAELSAALPGGWHVRDIHTGEMIPPGWSSGTGCRIRFARTPRTSDGPGRTAGWGAALYLIEPRRPSTRPAPRSASGPQPITLEELRTIRVPPAAQLMPWNGWQVLAALDAPESWPSFGKDMTAALDAARLAPGARARGATQAFVGYLEIGPARVDLIGRYRPGVVRGWRTEANAPVRLRPWLEPEAGFLESGDYLVCLRGGDVLALLSASPRTEPAPAWAQVPTRGPDVVAPRERPAPPIPARRSITAGLSPSSPSPGPVNVHAYLGERLMGSWVVRVGDPGAVIGVLGTGTVTLRWTWPDGRAGQKKIEVRDDSVHVWLDRD